jgi:hypothetical protein
MAGDGGDLAGFAAGFLEANDWWWETVTLEGMFCISRCYLGAVLKPQSVNVMAWTPPVPA